MIELLTIFSNNILPIFLIAGTGYLLARFVGVDPQPISRAVFYIFGPALLFTLLTTSDLSLVDFLKMVGFALASMLSVAILAWAVGKMLGLNRKLLAAVILVAAFGNSGNFGLSLNLFAFGDQALAHASLYFATMAALSYTFGVFVASSGTLSVLQATKNLIKVPALYAVLLAIILNILHWRLPLPVERTLETLSAGSIPALLVLIGIQLHSARGSRQYVALGVANGLRLVVSPLVAMGLAILFGLRGAAYQAGISEAAMPAAIVTTVLATEYEVEPAFVTASVLISTLLSPLTLTPLLAYLGA